MSHLKALNFYKAARFGAMIAKDVTFTPLDQMIGCEISLIRWMICATSVKKRC